MQNRHESILRTVNRKDKKYNILTFPTHERWQSNLAGMDHTFYLFQAKGIKGWNNKYAQLPKNHILLDGSENQVMPDMKFDIVFSQNKYGQYQQARAFSEFYGIPLVSIEHTLPMTWWTDKYIKKMTKMRGHANVFISKYSMEKWGYSEADGDSCVIHHAIDSNKFAPIEDGHNNGKILSVANDFINRGPLLGFDIYAKICLENNMPVKIVGDTPGLSLAAKTENELINEYQQASVFFNTSQVSPIPMSLLEAMSCGTPVVSTATCMIPEIIKDGYNGFLSNDHDVLKAKLEWCLKNPSEAKKIGENARKTIQENFSLKAHLDGWNRVFDSVFGKNYKGL